MSAPLLGVDKELKNNVPPPRANIRNAIFQLGLQLKGGVNIELINIWTGVPFFLKMSLMSTSHRTKKSSGPYTFIYMENGDI